MTYTFTITPDKKNISIEMKEKRDTKVLKTLVKDLLIPICNDISAGELLIKSVSLNLERLYTYCRKGMLERARLVSQMLITADIESCTHNGWCALQIAAFSGHIDIVQWLVEDIKVNIDVKSPDGWYALMCAARNGHTNIVDYLLKRGADCESHNNINESPCSYAVSNGHKEIVRSLAGKGL
jgi:hypothetical protein